MGSVIKLMDMGFREAIGAGVMGCMEEQRLALEYMVTVIIAEGWLPRASRG